jgi:hypothetical protein
MVAVQISRRLFNMRTSRKMTIDTAIIAAATGAEYFTP